MKRLIAFLGRFFGIYFAPDNHVIPVLRFGRYNRVGGPGFVLIIPLVEQALPPVKTSIHVGNFRFEEVLSKDNIPFEVWMTVLFTFDPTSALKNAAAMLVQSSEHLLRIIVEDYTNQGLRRLVSRFNAEELCSGSTMSIIEQHLARLLTAELRILGLAPLKNGGILIKETIAPEKFKRTMLNVKQQESFLEVLRSYPVAELVQLLNQVMFVNNLEDHPGNLALLMGSPEMMQMFPLLEQSDSQSGNGGKSP